MRKILLCSCISLNAFANSELEPITYADITESAVEDSVSFSGIRGIVGLGIHDLQLKSSTNPEKFEIGNAVVAVQYAKMLRNNMLLAVDVGTDISSVKKTNSSNHNNGIYATYTPSVKTNRFTPFASCKAGYWFKKHHLVGYIKAGFNRIGSTCDFGVTQIKANAFVPFIGIGAERKINSKWGIALECSVSIPKTITKMILNQQCKIKLNRKDIKIMATYDFAKK